MDVEPILLKSAYELKMNVTETVPTSNILPLQTVPDPFEPKMTFCVAWQLLSYSI